MTPCTMIEVIPTVATQNNRKSTIVILGLNYRAQVLVLCVKLADTLLDVELACPLLHVGQKAELPAVLGNADAFVTEPLLEHVGQ